MSTISYKFNNFDAILTQPIEPSAFFFIGDDFGQIHLFCKKIIDKYFGDDNKNISLFCFDEIIKNPEIVLIDTMSLDLFHSKKAVVIKNLKESIRSNEVNIFKNITQNNLLLLQGYNLKKSCKTTRELSKIAQMVNCYKLEVKQLVLYIQNFFNNQNIVYDQHIPFLIAKRIHENLLIVDNELNKIKIYIGKEKITDNTLNNICRYLQAPSIIQLCVSILNKDGVEINKVIEKINHDQTSKVAIIRQMQSFYHKVITLQKVQQDTSRDIATVINEFKPPIFFREKHIIQQICLNHSTDEVSIIRNELIDMEVKIKKYSIPEEVLFKEFVIKKLL